MNEYLQKQGHTRAGFITPTLYTLASSQQTYPAFHDVASGTNLFYPATASYDMGSGIGSPDVYNIARDLAGGSTTPPPTATPTPAPTSPATPIPTPPPSPTPQPTSTVTPPSPGSSLVQNGGFEGGVTGWQESSGGGYELVDSKNPHSGHYSAYLCGYASCNDVISQSFSLPASIGHLSVSYWWYGKTNRTTQSCRDTLSVSLLNSNGKVIKQLQQSCNANATAQWKRISVDVSSVLSGYAGQSVTLVISGRTIASQQTSSFFVDDIAVA